MNPPSKNRQSCASSGIFTVPVMDEMPDLRPVARVKFLAVQKGFNGGPDLKLFNVVGDAVLDGQNFKDSTVTIGSMMKRGFRVEIIPACSDLSEGELPDKLLLMFAVLRDRFEEFLILENEFGRARHPETLVSLAELESAAEAFLKLVRLERLGASADEAAVAAA
jgi:hypothetical protein